MDDAEFILKQFSGPEVCGYFDQEPFCKFEEAQKLIEWYARLQHHP